MAYTKIKPVKNHLRRCLDYTANPQKTVDAADLEQTLAYTQNGEKTENQLYVTGFNCDPANACDTMLRTKRRWNKDQPGHVLAYHVFQSFAPGEVTPEQAHKIGCELVQRLFAGRYEVTVSTHLDRKHLHNHIVLNAVSFVDGKMYRDDFRGYYGGLRKSSDDLCRTYGLSVIDPKRRGKTYAEWEAETAGKPTMRQMIRSDVDAVLTRAVSWETFVLGLRRLGYEVKCGPHVKYAALRHKTGQRSIRLKSLGEAYTEEAIRRYFAQRAEEAPRSQANRPAKEMADCRLKIPPQKQRPRSARCRSRSTFPARGKITGFLALYYRYLYLLGKARQKRTSKRCHYLLREDFQKFDRYLAQCDFLWEHHIQTQEELAAVKAQTQAEMDSLARQRAQLYKKRANSSNGLNKADLSAQIRQLTEQMRRCRKTAALCGMIQCDAEAIRQRLAEVKREEQREYEQRQKEVKNHEQRW